MREQPLLSIIIPVFNTEKFLNKCIDSILNQTYTNLEVILVNDATKDNSVQIIKQYEERDSRVKLINHDVNKGLFQARLTGTEIANGKYIAFVDSDDYVTEDFYRILIREAEKENADITMGNTVLEDENNWKYIYNIPISFTKSRNCLEGKEIIHELFEDEGLYYSWHTVWNKIYTKSLWEKCVEHYKKINKHLIMTEDIVFSTVLYYYANKLKFVDHDAYIYYRHSEASTGTVKNLNSLRKNIDDLNQAFNFVREFMKEVEIYEIYEKKYLSWRRRYFRWWSYNVKEATEKFNNKQSKELLQYFLKVFEEEKLCLANKDDGFFSQITTGWQQQYEQLKKEICNPAIKYVSFDIFDTLILRPLLEPTDLFLFMEGYFKELLPNTKSAFSKIRKISEEICRKNMRIISPFYEDVNLKEIYEEMNNVYKIPKEICIKLMKKEEELEIEFCKPRYAIKEIYELALEVGKEVILISDMYLPKETINKILDKNGYNRHKKLYLSSEERMLKYSKNLFKRALEDLNIKPEEVIHLGDNYKVDIEASKELGMKSHYIPKTKDVFLNQTYLKKSLDSSIYINPQGTLINYANVDKELSTRCLLAIVANKMFDNPYVSFNKDTCFNADSYYIGYYLLGMNMLGLNKWLIEDTLKKDYKTIHFIARDGYIPKKVYDIIAPLYKDAPKSSYVYASRKSLIPTIIRESVDLLSLSEYITIKNHTPRTLLKLLQPLLKELDSEIEKIYLDKNVLLDVKFNDIHQFNLFINLMIEISYDQQIVDDYYQSIKRYFSDMIAEGDCTFDLGYSGKIQKMLIDILGYRVDTYFLHSNGGETDILAKENRFEVNSYYSSTPSVSGIIREYLVSDYGPSCIGYTVRDKGVIPIFEDKELLYQEKYVLDEMFKGITDFAEDFVEYFGEYIHMFSFKPIETSSALEQFLCNPNTLDRLVFSSSYIEDEVYGGVSSLEIKECWEWNLKQKGFLNRSNNGNMSINMPKELEDLYLDGLFMTFYKQMNKFLPKGSRKREYVKKTVRLFMK